MVSDLEQKRQFRGQKSSKLAKPTKICEVCGKGYEFKLITSGLPDMGGCEPCRKLLSEGWVAFVADNRYSFVKSDLSDIAHWRGHVVHISPEHMDTLEIRFKLKALEKSESDPKAG